MSWHIVKTYSVQCKVCGAKKNFTNQGKKAVIRALKSKGWVLSKEKGWACPKHGDDTVQWVLGKETA